MDAAWSSDLKRAFTALKDKQERYARLWSYYDGNHPLVYVSPKLRNVFRNLDARWHENWAAVVVDSLLDRMVLKGFKCADGAMQAALDEWWDALEVSADAEDVHKAVTVCAEGFYLAEEGDEGVRSFANDPHLCAVLYHEDDPKRMEFAAKWWESDGATYLTLYYPERLLHFRALKKRAEISSADAFEPDGEKPEEPNAYGEIPVFHFRRDRRGKSRLTDVIPLNNALNKLFADMMVAAEYGAFKKRWIISSVEIQEGTLKAGPNEVDAIPGTAKEDGQPTSVGQFEATELANFIAGLDYIASRIAILTHTPKHYLLQQGDVSGEALIAMEAPLVREAASYMARMEATWKRVAAFVMKLSGRTVSPDDIECVWDDEHTVQPYTESLIHVENAKAGIPITTQLRREGWSEEELAQMAADEDGAQARTTSLADVALAVAEARRKFDSGEQAGPYPQGTEAR